MVVARRIPIPSRVTIGRAIAWPDTSEKIQWWLDPNLKRPVRQCDARNGISLLTNTPVAGFVAYVVVDRVVAALQGMVFGGRRVRRHGSAKCKDCLLYHDSGLEGASWAGRYLRDLVPHGAFVSFAHGCTGRGEMPGVRRSLCALGYRT